ncbi:hypothetical protein [Streptomyces cucumeris]|uniref:hypothetical protein n=1 Tax=Streptomyces cucumeris TaxID=2962890 RepID=UPI0020C863B9|nr:hypothetical protein [Streptomyces sp. NEAU-Y11]MCP9209651.1 hypothetical protein [Streptomyces sp. NEAU-Y11]
MGIRIHKKIGWGITGLEHDERGILTDSRVNADALLQSVDEVGTEYLKYLESRRDEEEDPDERFELMSIIGMVDAAQAQGESLWWPVTREDEAGRQDVLLVQPVGMPGWSRYDDPIDFAEEGALHGPIEPRVVPLERGIYPLEGAYMDSRDGRRLDPAAKRFLDRLMGLQGEDEGRQRYGRTADRLAESMGFNDAHHARQHIAPAVPADIRHVCSWLNLFTDPDMWLQLRPMLYVYWG